MYNFVGRAPSRERGTGAGTKVQDSSIRHSQIHVVQIMRGTVADVLTDLKSNDSTSRTHAE